MKLLFDQNIARLLVQKFATEFPGSTHTADIGLETSSDQAVWNYAKEHGFTIISKDSDFHQRCFLYGHPPKVIWVRLGNCTTEEIQELIESSLNAIKEFGADEASAFLILDS